MYCIKFITIPQILIICNIHAENGIIENQCMSAHSWVGSVAVCRNSDLASSGAGNGAIRLWEIERESKGLRPLFELPLVSFHMATF